MNPKYLLNKFLCVKLNTFEKLLTKILIDMFHLVLLESKLYQFRYQPLSLCFLSKEFASKKGRNSLRPLWNWCFFTFKVNRIQNSNFHKSSSTHWGSDYWPFLTQKVPKEAFFNDIQISVRLFKNILFNNESRRAEKDSFNAFDSLIYSQLYFIILK